MKIFSKNTYELYLYSDPINYLMIPLLYDVYRESLFINNTVCVFSFFVRFLITLIASFGVIYIVNKINIKNFVANKNS